MKYASTVATRKAQSPLLHQEHSSQRRTAGTLSPDGRPVNPFQTSARSLKKEREAHAEVQQFSVSNEQRRQQQSNQSNYVSFAPVRTHQTTRDSLEVDEDDNLFTCRKLLENAIILLIFIGGCYFTFQITYAVVAFVWEAGPITATIGFIQR